MKDTIYRQDAIDAIYGITSYKGTIPLDSAIFNIKKLPSADASLMQDSYHHYNPPSISVKSPRWFGFKDVDDNDYCSRAERRTDDKPNKSSSC